MKHRVTFFLTLLSIFASSTAAFAQGSDLYKGGIHIPVGQDSSKYIRIILLNQFWAKWTENNPGTVGADGELAEHSFDIGVRRARATVYSQISPRFLIFTQFGINNQTFINGGAPGQGPKKPQMFFHDAWTQYTVVPGVNPLTKETNVFSLDLGMGLHFWNGVSRFSNASVASFMTVDLPVYNFPNIERTDQFGRQYGIFAKGKAGPLDYRFHMNKPFVYSELNQVNEERAVNIPSDKVAWGGYVAYEFLEREGNLLPYRTETYVGSKKVFNLGAGFYHQPEASGILAANATLEKQDHTAWAVDAFLDYPFGVQGMAVTAYSVLYNYNYGTNYYRSVGIMNTASGQTAAPAGFDEAVSVDGFGNAEPLLGTGSIWMTQAGLLLPGDLIGSLGKLQPFARLESKNLDYLDDNVFQTDFGINWFIEGQNAKITLQYGTREVFIRQGSNIISDQRKGQWTLQTQIYI
ncbi:porin [Porifericola rhodea]|uniref:porin n=1 Tax=Porifericola rhodea TaxID=930972 RepID=UPI002664E946|nr:porin [Porifericola rhodea]WKN30047.1 porin [Porifericola rhodea]